MNATFSPSVQAYYGQLYELATSCTTLQYVLWASLAAQELLSLYHLASGRDDENWDWDGSEQSLAETDDDGQSLMSEILASASSELSCPEMYHDLMARVSRSRSPLHFVLQVARSRLAERVTGISLNALLSKIRGGPHRDVARRRAGKLIEKVRGRHIESITSSNDSEFQSVASSSSSSPPSSTDESKE